MKSIFNLIGNFLALWIIGFTTSYAILGFMGVL